MLRDYFTEDLFTITIMVSLLLIVTVKQLFNSRFSDFLETIWSVKYIKLYSRDRKKIDLFNNLLFINFIIALSLFIHFAYSNFIEPLPKDSFTLLTLFIGLAILSTVKSGLEHVISFFIETSDIISAYNFQKATYKNFSGLLLCVINIFILFSFWDVELLIYIGFILLLLINIIGFIRFLRLYQKAVISNFFYFLLYLCALEIGPYIILYKAIKDYFG